MSALTIGSTGFAVRRDELDYRAQHLSRKLVIYDQTPAYWVARMEDSPESSARWWIRKRDLVIEPKGNFQQRFKPANTP